MIPRILHTIWIGDKKRPEGSKIWKDVNSEYTHMHWDEYRLRQYIKGSLTNGYVMKYLGRKDEQYSDKYCGAVDILRLLVLKKYGGIYFDADCTPSRPLTDDLLDNEFFSAYENEEYCPDLVANAVMGCPPDHPVICSMINNLKNRPISTDRAWVATGPTYLAETLREYQGDYTIYPSYYFLPKHWSGVEVDRSGFEPYCDHWFGTTHNKYK